MPTISFINMKGGVAKTTLAINVADVLNRQHHYRVMVVDVDPQFNATQCMINPADYVDYLENGGECTTNIFDNKAQIVASTVAGAKKTEPKEGSSG